MKDYKTECSAILRRWAALKGDRQSWMSEWQKLAQFFTPRGGRFLEGGNKGSRGNAAFQHILDNSPLRSVDVATAGLVAGMTSPARPWFRLKTPDAQLNKKPAVKKWLSDLEFQMRDVMAHSNTYRSFRRGYEENIIFGTEATHVIPDFKDVVRHYPLTIGEYAISMNDREEVDTIYRRFEMSVEQLVGRFGEENCSQPVKDAYNKGEYLQWRPVIHAIEPRKDRDEKKADSSNMAWKSCYMEIGENGDKLLQDSGFKRFPGIVARWKTQEHDSYGEAPAMRAIGDNKQLQQQQFRKSQGIDYMTLPPLSVPSSLIGAMDLGAGGINQVDSVGQGIKSAFEVNLNLDYLLNDIRDVRQRISKVMFEDLFLMFSTPGAGIQPPTAEEVAAKKEEQLLMIGPVLENLHNEKLAPAIETTFAAMLEAGIVPPPPPEMGGMPLLIQFSSVLAQAQKLIGLGGVDRIIGVIANLEALKPGSVDKLNSDETIDFYSDVLGVPPDLIVANDQVVIIRQQRAQQQAQQQAMAAIPEGAKAAKALGDTNVPNVNAAVAALSSLGGNP